MMKPIFTKPMLGFLLMVLLGLYSSAQEKNDQVTVKITKDIDGDTQTFEKTYASEEEMKADALLKEFMGKDDQMRVWFSEDAKGPKIIELEEMGDDPHRFFFKFGDEDMAQNFHFFEPGDSAMSFDIEMERLGDEFRSMEKTIRRHFESEDGHRSMAFSFGDDDDEFDWHFSDSLSSEIREKMDRARTESRRGHRDFEVRVLKKVAISDDVEAFGKKGAVKTSDQLDLNDLRYFPNPAPDGRFHLKFDTPQPGELSIKIYNTNGKEVFNRYFEKYGGRYSEMIDLSQQSEGIYLLEISMDGKRLTRKIAID
ncbi:T9SS type A sorting domain-containing protein [Marinoscillum luteum]|uniref:T9SS type A sorting domain-containing protein n=1 Tax=Marinoscillum luteum TaxID=861051 RepID=A0ABW7N8M7_9BACT